MSKSQIIVIGGIIVLILIVVITMNSRSGSQSATDTIVVTEPAPAQPPAEISTAPEADTTPAVAESVEMEDEMMDEEMDSESMMGEEDTMEDSEEPMMDDMSEASAASEPGTFQAYSQDKLALAEGGNVVLFFHADWCPSCRGLESNIEQNLSEIPENTHILKLDYDSETALKQKYGVVRQHTLVVVDANGNEIKKLTGLTNTLDQVVNQL